MKITDIRTRAVEWHGPTVPPQPHFCTNPMDLLQLSQDAMAGFRFHGWLVVEIFTDAGHVGIELCGAIVKAGFGVWASRCFIELSSIGELRVPPCELAIAKARGKRDLAARILRHFDAEMNSVGGSWWN